MSRIINVNGFVEFLHDTDRELYHAELLRLVERYMGKEFSALVEDELEELVEALRAADELESKVVQLEVKADRLQDTIDWLQDKGYRPMG